MSRLIDKSSSNVAMTIKSTSAIQSNSASTTSSSSSNVTGAIDKSQLLSSIDNVQNKNSNILNEKERSSKTIDNVDAVLISLFAGAIAGALAKTTIAPLDRTKINFQINKNIPYSFGAALNFLKCTYNKEGFFALWRGNSATMARIVPYAAIQFTAHEEWKKLLKVDKTEETKVRRYLAGSLAGVTSQSLTYPLDLARARMAVTDKYTGYKTLRQVFKNIWINEGPKTFYRGYWATILGVIPYAGTSFFTYETLKRKYNEMNKNEKPGTLISLAFGAVAGLAGQTSSYPLDIVRRRMQTMGIAKNTEKYSTIISTLTQIYKTEGIKNGIFKGLSMNWIKGPIAVGISFSTYDYIRQLLRELAHYKKGRIEISG